jgi:Holliday junction DNA helicase RuvB
MTFIGHEEEKRQIKIAMYSAKKRNEALPHMMFAGAAGCGKTSMAKEVAKQANTSFISASSDDLKDDKSIKSLMKNLNESGYDEQGCRTEQIKPSILFLDEIHELSLKGQEILGIVMEEFKMHSSRPNRFYWIPYFTMIGATTNDGILSKPFRDRFKFRFVFEPYTDEEIIEILFNTVEDYEMVLTPASSRMIAKRSRGIPRIAKGYLERVRDMAFVSASRTIATHIVRRTFEDLGIDEEGLTKVEQKILETLYTLNMPVGVENLSIIVNEAPKTLIESAEPFLIQKGYLVRGGRGRIITPKGIEYLESKKTLRRAKKRVDIKAGFVRT